MAPFLFLSESFSLSKKIKKNQKKFQKNHGTPRHVPRHVSLYREFTTRRHVPHGIPACRDLKFSKSARAASSCVAVLMARRTLPKSHLSTSTSSGQTKEIEQTQKPDHPSASDKFGYVECFSQDRRVVLKKRDFALRRFNKASIHHGRNKKKKTENFATVPRRAL